MLRPTIRDTIKTKLDAGLNEEEIVAVCVKELKVKQGSVADVLRDLRKQNNAMSKRLDTLECDTSGKVVGLSLSEMKDKYDPIEKIKKALELIQTRHYVPESEFRDKLVRCGTSSFRTAANNQQFDGNKGIVKGTTYWGHTEDIQRLKDEGILV